MKKEESGVLRNDSAAGNERALLCFRPLFSLLVKTGLLWGKDREEKLQIIKGPLEILLLATD